MNRRIATLWALGLILSLTVYGCTLTPREGFIQTQDAYISVVNVLLEARSAGDIDETTWQDDILPLINLGDEALDQYDAETAAGLPGETSLLTIHDILAQLKPYVVKYVTRE